MVTQIIDKILDFTVRKLSKHYRKTESLADFLILLKRLELQDQRYWTDYYEYSFEDFTRRFIRRSND